MALTKTVQYYLARFGAHAVAPRRRRRRHLHRRERAAARAATSSWSSRSRPRSCSSSTSCAGAGCSRSSRSGLWGFISIVVGTIYPAVIQRSSCSRTSSRVEQPYIKRNIDATRAAFGLDNITIADVRLRRRAHAGRGRRREQADARQRAALGPGAAAPGAVQVTEEITPFYSFSDVDVDRYKVGGKTRRRRVTRVGARARPRAAARATRGRTSTSCTRTASASIAAARQRASTATSRATCSPTSRRPASSMHRLKQPDVYFGEGLSRLLGRRHQGRRAGGERRERHAKATKYSGNGGREGVEPAAQARVRAAVRRLQPLVLGPGHDQLAGPLHPRRQGAGADRRAVPAVGRRPVRGRARRPDPVGARRLHHDEPLPVLAVDPSRTCRRAAGSTPTSTTCATR